MRAALAYLKVRARGGMLVVAGTLVALQTFAGTVFDLVIGALLIGLVALASRIGR